uniref:WAP domain-containing protein n=1 Tax=Angiostrongylus cantonensis TaxID=6313 RepID=A0A0K0D847_ANGCA
MSDDITCYGQNDRVGDVRASGPKGCVLPPPHQPTSRRIPVLGEGECPRAIDGNQCASVCTPDRVYVIVARHEIANPAKTATSQKDTQPASQPAGRPASP